MATDCDLGATQPPDFDELGHTAMCAWNGWEPSAKTREIWDEWAVKAPQSRAAWERVAIAILEVAP